MLERKGRMEEMDSKRLITILGIITVLISISTWIMDFAGWVETCIYCRNERTIIGLLGLLLLLPKHKLLSPYLAVTLGFYGAYVASDQIFNNMIDAKIGIMFILATGALLIISLQVYTLLLYVFNDAKNNRTD